MFGVFIGAFITSITNYIVEKNKNKKQKKLDTVRQEVLQKMLEDKAFKWRNLSTLSRVIGCTEEETKEHLISIDARGSENNDGKWGLISDHPLENIRGVTLE